MALPNTVRYRGMLLACSGIMVHWRSLIGLTTFHGRHAHCSNTNLKRARRCRSFCRHLSNGLCKSAIHLHAAVQAGVTLGFAAVTLSKACACLGMG